MGTGRPPSSALPSWAGASSTRSSSSCPILMPLCDFHSKLTSSTNKQVSTMLLSQTHLTPKSAREKKKVKKIKELKKKNKTDIPNEPFGRWGKKRHPSSLLSSCIACAQPPATLEGNMDYSVEITCVAGFGLSLLVPCSPAVKH